MPGVYQSIQGNMGFGKAIEYFTSHGITVALPLNDTQKYDLIADFNGGLQRVSVKTGRYSENNGKSYAIMLKNCGGTSKGSVIRKFDNTTCDYVFIYTASNDMYLIPAKEITSVSSITVGIKYIEYKVYSKTLQDFDKENREE